MESVSIIGIGRMGGALALALSRAGYEVENLIYRSEPVSPDIFSRISSSAHLLSFADLQYLNSDIIFITSADPEIAAISRQIASKVKAGSSVFHASGSLSSEILSDLTRVGCYTGSIHPLVSISDPIRGSKSFAGAFYCVEGQDNAVAVAKEIVANLGGESFSIDTRHKSLYHASAVTASGHLVALVDVAVEMLTKCGVEPDEAKRIMMPLIKSTLENLQGQSNAKALTGTFARADVPAFERHLDGLKESVSGEILQVYLNLGNRSLDLAELEGQDTNDIRKIRDGILLALRTAK